MFTGLITQVGSLASRSRQAGGWRLEISHKAWPTPLELGESVAVQGVCLTVARSDRASFQADMLDETADLTTLTDVALKAPLNLERALRVGDRMGGHFVTGHVDGQGQVVAIERAGRDWMLTVASAPERLAEMVPKGSITIDGTSLTIAALTETTFTVCIIPHTWTHTSLAALQVAGAVNLETDMIGKYVRRSLGLVEGGGASTLTMDRLRDAGFM
jgi:riboflavin synthase